MQQIQHEVIKHAIRGPRPRGSRGQMRYGLHCAQRLEQRPEQRMCQQIFGSARPPSCGLLLRSSSVRAHHQRSGDVQTDSQICAFTAMRLNILQKIEPQPPPPPPAPRAPHIPSAWSYRRCCSICHLLLQLSAQ